MRRSALLLLLLAACGESSAVKASPLDAFAFPSALAVTERSSGGSALLVASANFDLLYDGGTGGTLISVDPVASAGAAGGALTRLGQGAHFGSFAGQLVVAEDASCPGYADPIGGGARTALVPSRFTNSLALLPVDPDGAVAPCTGAFCEVPLETKVHDPYAVALACRADGQRRSAFVGYLEGAILGTSGTQGYLTELDLDSPGLASRRLAVGNGPVAALAYDASTDRLYVAGRPLLLSAPLYALDLTACRAGTCAAAPAVHSHDFFAAVRGAELQGLVLSNPQAGLSRRAYLTARVYDASLFALLGGRPSADVTGVLLVVDLTEDETGAPSFELVRKVDVGLGPGQVVVLPTRPRLAGAPRRDVVVLTSSLEGAVTVYDDDVGDVVQIMAVDPATGAPQAGREAYGLAVEPTAPDAGAGPVARAYVAAFKQGVVTPIDVPLLAPGQAHPLRSGPGGLTGDLLRIGVAK